MNSEERDGIKQKMAYPYFRIPFNTQRHTSQSLNLKAFF